jgi:hypothetical protein
MATEALVAWAGGGLATLYVTDVLSSLEPEDEPGAAVE